MRTNTLALVALYLACFTGIAMAQTEQTSINNLIDGRKIPAERLKLKQGTGSVYYCTNNGIISVIQNGKLIQGKCNIFTTFTDRNDRVKWMRSIYPAYIDESMNLLLGYAAKYDAFEQGLSFGAKDTIYAYRLSDGKRLWKAPQKHYMRWGWNDVKKLSPTRMLVWNDNLQIIAPQRGVLYQRPMQAGKYGVPIVSKWAKGTTTRDVDADRSYPPFMDPGFFSGIKSNVVVKENKIYVADAKFVYCLDDKLNLIWGTPLPEKKTSVSRLYIKGDKVELLNGGFAYLSTETYNVGHAFAATFDVNTGKQLTMTDISVKGDVIDIHLNGNKGFFLTDNGSLAVVDDMANAEVRYIQNKDLKGTTDILDTEVYIRDNNNMKGLVTGECRMLLVNKKGQYIEVDCNGKTTAMANPGDTYRRTGRLFVNKPNPKKDEHNIIITNHDNIIKTEIKADATYTQLEYSSHISIVTGQGIIRFPI